MLVYRRGFAKQLVNLATLVTCLSGCDSLVSPDYLGESRLQLRVRVENQNADTEDEAIVPALAHAQGGQIRFSAAEVRGQFPAAFQVDVFGEPSAEQDAFTALAPDSAVAFLYLAAVPRSRLEQPLVLPQSEPNPECWDGSCDVLPGERPTRESSEDSERAEECPDADCVLSATGPSLPKLQEDLVGFAREHVVLFTRAALRPQSWPARRVGAPDGLAAGYHLAKLLEPQSAAQQEASECYARAASEVLDAYNAEHDSAFDPHALDCLIVPFEGCGPRDVPTGAAAKALATGLAQSEVDHGCLELAPDLAIVSHPEREQITVRLGELFPTVNPLPAVSRDESANQTEVP